MVNHAITAINVANARMVKKNIVIFQIKIAKNTAAFKEDGKAKTFVRIMFHAVAMAAVHAPIIHSVLMIRNYRLASAVKRNHMKNA